MYIIVDMEWIDDYKGHAFPTQIAASKVDDNWQELDSFSSFITPKNSGLHDWKHVSYTGGTPDDFLNAPNIKSVFSDFNSWIEDDDILIWWHPQAEHLYPKLLNRYVHIKRKVQSLSINKYVYSHLIDQENATGSYYNMAECRGVDANMSLQHFSPNDVRVLREFLIKIELPQAMLKVSPKSLRKVDHEQVVDRNKPYQYDRLTKILHKKDCKELVWNKLLPIGFDSLDTPVKNSYRPCECCRVEYYTSLMQRNADIINRSQFTYLYTPDSKIYHKYTCKAMLLAKNILGARTFKPIEKSGRVPCKICHPSPNDEYRPYTVYVPRVKPKRPQTNISREDQRAINRQKIAIETRNRKLKDKSLSKTQVDDIYTLTQPRFAFWVGQGYETFHLRNCPKLQNISNLKGFALFSEARKAGYSPCKKCKPTKKHDANVSVPIRNRKRTNEKITDLEYFCRLEGYEFSVENDTFFCLETPVGKWKINLTSTPVKLHHINLVMTPNSTTYHEQPRIFLSLLDTFDYIKRHDEELAKRTIIKDSTNGE